LNAIELKKMPQRERFQIQTYPDAQLEALPSAQRKLRSSTFVAELEFGSGPASGDIRTYILSGNKKGWKLWQKGNDYDTGKPLHCVVAFGWPAAAVGEKEAASQLLENSLRTEESLSDFSVLEEGLLNRSELKAIGRRIRSE
jgi:hypothetical protein